MSTVIDTLSARNAAFASAHFNPALKLLPTLKTMILGCVDPRVDPGDVLGLELGETAIIRNVGGRVTPDVLDTLEMLRLVSAANGGKFGPGWNLIVLHHTDCGIKRLNQETTLLGRFFGIPPIEVEGKAVMDPHASVKLDIAALRAAPNLSPEWTVSGLVYDVATGLTEIVVAPSLLHA